MSPLPITLRVLLTVAALGSLATGAPAQESELSKSISSGWESVVKQTKKAAKSVSKAANDALTPDKKKRRKSSKTKKASEKSVAEDDKPSERKSRDGDKAAGKDAGRPARDKRETRSSSRAAEDEGPPVPLYREAPADRAAGAPPADKAKAPAKTNATARRLPPPPPTGGSDRNFGSGWSATSVDDDGREIPQADVTPSGKRKGKDQPAAPSAKPLPITMIPPKAAEGTAPADTWSKDEIETAKANCDAILKNVAAVTVPEAPVRDGACGAPAPVRLVSIGRNPEIKLSPQPLVTCDLVAGLAQWMQNDIQPLAKKHLGASVSKIETMSDYSCRMAYGRKGNKLSEHGRANALDIRGFVTTKGEVAHVLEAWGKTQRDLVAEAAKVAAEQAAAEKAAEAAAAAGSTSAAVEVDSANAADLGERPQPAVASLGVGLKPALHSKAQKAAAVIVPEAPHSKKAQFLRDAHTAACRIFGTSLGPESNEAHRNHFHVDMAERKRRKICE